MVGSMEAEIGSQGRHLSSTEPSKGRKKKSLEWDLNDWKWDGNLFVATPLNAAPSDCQNKRLYRVQEGDCGSSSLLSGFKEIDFGLVEKESEEPEKRRRILVLQDGEPDDEGGPLALNLGADADPVAEVVLDSHEERNEQNDNSTRLSCKVDGCVADLSKARDYHRRHKVCEMHSKASTVVVGNTMQRFCQQCSRFHLLQEFDEGKRSCRRRLAHHNGRRRKANANATSSGSILDDANGFLLRTLLKMISNLETTNSDRPKDPDVLTHLLIGLTGLAGSSVLPNISGQSSSQQLHRFGNSAGTLSEDANAPPNGLIAQELPRPTCAKPKDLCTIATQPNSVRTNSNLAASAVVSAERPSNINVTVAPRVDTQPVVPCQRNAMLIPVDHLSSNSKDLCAYQNVMSTESPMKCTRLMDLDLNTCYSDQEHFLGGCQPPIGVHNSPCWMVNQTSPQQMSGNSDSSSQAQGSNGDAQGRTDKIVLKLFGKDPSDFPLDLRSQILSWLSHYPTDMESFIRPGCVVLTVYLRLADSVWEEFTCGVNAWMERLTNITNDDFWSIGWIFARVQHHMAFIYNGRVALEAPLLPSSNQSKILYVTPIAVSCSSTVKFFVNGLNLALHTTRVLCAFDGKYLLEETAQALLESNTIGAPELQCLSFSCFIPNATGRGFIEVEDYDHSSVFFPFVVAEDDVCSEIRMLESEINVVSCDNTFEERPDLMNAHNRAINFLQEMGWLLRRCHVQSRSEQYNSLPDAFPVTRFRQLISFSMDREWCSVLKKLLDVLFLGNIGLNDSSPVEFVQEEDLLHCAVRKRSKSLVEFLLRYSTDSSLKVTSPVCFLFTPDMMGPLKITPLHIAATISGAESVLDALTDDPQQVGPKAWKTVRDVSGFTPEDYARMRGHHSYIQMVQGKIDRRIERAHLLLDIPTNLVPSVATDNHPEGSKSGQRSSLKINNSKVGPLQRSYCKRCDQRAAYRPPANGLLVRRPVVLSMMAIATVCVCIGLIMRGPPAVKCIEHPFTWESLGHGSI